MRVAVVNLGTIVSGDWRAPFVEGDSLLADDGRLVAVGDVETAALDSCDVVIDDAPLGATRASALATMSNGDPVAIGGDDYSSAVMPYFGEIHNPNGIGGAVVALTDSERLSLRTHVNQNPRDIRVYGADTALTIGRTLRLHAVMG